MYAITQRGRPAFQALNDKTKTEAVCLHAVKHDPLILSDIKIERRTQEMADIAFAKNPETFSYFLDTHITQSMILKLFENRMSQQIRRIEHMITQEVADYVMLERPEHIEHVPERFLTAQALAAHLIDNPDRLGFYKDVKKCVEAIAISVEQLKGASPIWLDWISRNSRPETIAWMVTQYKNDTLPKNQNSLEIFYITLYRLNAHDPVKLAAKAQDIPELIDVLQLIHGSDIALKYFPKAPNRGQWLMGDLGV
jgi:hypothetical protein